MTKNYDMYSRYEKALSFSSMLLGFVDWCHTELEYIIIVNP